MALPSLKIIITGGNLGRQAPDADNVAAMVINGVAGLPSLVNTRTVIYSLKQAESLGITADYDDTQKVLYYYHIAEFFRINPNGELHVIMFDTSDGYNYTDIFGDSTTPSQLEPYLVAANGRIKQIAYIDPSFDVTDILIVIPTAQGLVEKLSEQHIWIDVVYLEALEFEGPVGSVPDLRAANARNVAVVVGRDPLVGRRSSDYQGASAIGTLLGSSTNKAVHESLAWAKDENTITSVADNAFLSADITLSDPNTPDTFANDNAALTELHDKGFIFPRQYPLRSGYYWNQSSNCVTIDKDINSIELSQVINKAIRLISEVLSTRINQVFDVEDGRLTETERKIIEAEIRKILDINLSDNISSLGTLQVDPAVDENNQAYPSILSDATLRAVVGLVPKGKSEQIILSIGYEAG